ncbi:MAG: four helix bundle protein [Candidatus Uhrbacteria bacterium]
MINNFLDLRTWQESRLLVKEIYRIIEKFPDFEKYNIISQLRSSAVSIAANIAEGMGRSTTKDLCRFLIQARGSLHETISHLILAKDLGYISDQDLKELENRYWGFNVGINNHINSLKDSDNFK